MVRWLECRLDAFGVLVVVGYAEGKSGLQDGLGYYYADTRFSSVRQDIADEARYRMRLDLQCQEGYGA